MKYIIPTIETNRLILKKGTYEDYVQVYEYDYTRLRNINGEFEFVKYDPEKLRGVEKYADEEENVLDFIVYLKDNNKPIGNIVYDRYKCRKEFSMCGKNKIYNWEYVADKGWIYCLGSFANSKKNTNPGRHLYVTIGTNKNWNIDQTWVSTESSRYPKYFADNVLFSGRAFPEKAEDILHLMLIIWM